jgi:signal transduction histidine kinase/DNA-binding response OmpR family regulator
MSTSDPPVTDRSRQRRAVLVVEDNPTAAKMLVLALEAEGYSVLAALDAVSALGHLGRGSADLVILDLVLPDMDGIALLRTIRALPNGKALPVIALSGFRTLLDSAKAEAHGFDATMMKPAPPAEVAKLVRKFLPLPVRAEPASAAQPTSTRAAHRPVERETPLPAELDGTSSLQVAQLAILAGIADALLRSDDLEAAFGDVLTACLDSGGISRGALYGLGDSDELILRQALGFPPEAAQALADAFGCSPHVVRAGRGAVIATSACLPAASERAFLQATGLNAGVFIPFIERDRCAGALLLGSSSPEMSERGLISFARAVGGHIAQALALTESFSRMRDSAEAGRALNASLDQEETLTALASLATARLADVCEVELMGEAPRVYTSDRVGDLSPASGPKSEISLPLVAHGRVLGHVALARVDESRPFTAADRIAAEDLVNRAATAIDNASLYKAAQDANRAKDEFLATVSHELRTPLTSILGWARMLKKGVEDSRREHAYSVIERNAVAQAQLIEDLLDTSRIISGQMRLDLQTTDLSALIDTAIESIKPALELKNIKLRRFLPDGSVRIRADAARLQQVIWNLLSNAAKFTPPGGQIQINVVQQEARISISVSDDGRGISPEFLDFVFDRFRQADASITRSYGGLGLGLAISRHLVELHGGVIRVESEGKGQGAVFTIELPFVPAHASERTLANRDSRPSNPRAVSELANVSILVVDDDEDTRELLLEVLANCGAQARGAASAEEAFAEFAQFRPDILLSDIGMPGEDGYQLIRRLRTLPATQGGMIPAAAITAYNRSEDRMLAFDAGFQLHIAKPIDLAEVVAAAVSLSQMAAAAKATH